MTMAIGIGIATGWQKPSGGPTCGNFRYATVGSYMGLSSNFFGWTIDGLDLYANYVSVINSKGCYTNNPVTNGLTSGLDQEFIIYYYGTSDPVFTILDSLGNAIPLTWKTICDKTCYQADIPSSSYFFSEITNSGVDFLYGLIISGSTWGASIDLSSPSSMSAVEAYYKQLAGTSTIITSVYEPLSDTYIVQIKNAYLTSSPAWNGNYFYQISC